jgi:DnaK suppressor protein
MPDLARLRRDWVAYGRQHAENARALGITGQSKATFVCREGGSVATKSVAAKSVAAKSVAAKSVAPKSVAPKGVAKKVKELTDQDLLKAPERDYMNEAQLAFFRQRLVELRAQLLNNADDTGQHLRENEVTTDPSDRATLEEEYTLELRTRDRERKLLKKVEKSLKMIDDGSYGYCEETGEPIGIPRLLARPTATLSLEAQERRERVQKLYGD